MYYRAEASRGFDIAVRNRWDDVIRTALDEGADVVALAGQASTDAVPLQQNEHALSTNSLSVSARVDK